MTRLMDEPSPYLRRECRSELEVARQRPSRMNWEMLGYERLTGEVERLRRARMFIEIARQRLRELAEPAEDSTRSILAEMDEYFHDMLGDLDGQMGHATDELESRPEGA